ncbi:2-amino-4-hydroxy-6-hydroxymethyldihydropteridine diphosphokinase [Luteimicrobium subarcticum]|uniref:Bifunctional folate synthesis protein n=1 Tax=Luteimicrobium subarcticum TaxID=620910 RepID=A0A2M8WSN8_9MICO|nr:2-amino-4-hydroxy-6-hydroxymethyldihydropteridine diphosphokinase [Luteimicrobium subarcticum]PJI93943.1 dihydroneopterin aldolase/2-amino-4-hydroxy-6-hydroxymethyldihydropteridine diphosphokinase [Luteimicrobium subarcticum]
MTVHQVIGADGEPLDQIRLVGLRATGYHGVLAHERVEGQEFVADVVLHLDTRQAAAGDDLEATVDYGVLAEQVVAVLEGDPADLVETVAERVAAVALAAPTAFAVDVTLHKPQAPVTVPFDDVQVSVHRSRTRPPVLELVPPVPAQHEDVPGAAAAMLPDPAGSPDTPSAGTPSVDTPSAGTPSVGTPATGTTSTEVASADPGVTDTAEASPAHVPADVAVVGVAGLAAGGAAVDAEHPADRPATAQDELSDDEPTQMWSAADYEEHVGAPPAPARELDRMDEEPEEPVEVVLALGANVGDTQQTLRDAITALDSIDGLHVVDVSPLARTAPVGGVDQDDFLNAVVVASTTMSARELLHTCHDVEHSFGRVREERWGPRTLDVDIVVYGTLTDVATDLELPHPRAHERAFVLEPWSQVQPDAVLPGLGGGPVAQLAATAPDRTGIRWLALDWLGTEEPSADSASPDGPSPDEDVAYAYDDLVAQDPEPSGEPGGLAVPSVAPAAADDPSAPEVAYPEDGSSTAQGAPDPADDVDAVPQHGADTGDEPGRPHTPGVPPAPPASEAAPQAQGGVSPQGFEQDRHVLAAEPSFAELLGAPEAPSRPAFAPVDPLQHHQQQVSRRSLFAPTTSATPVAPAPAQPSAVARPPVPAAPGAERRQVPEEHSAPPVALPPVALPPVSFPPTALAQPPQAGEPVQIVGVPVEWRRTPVADEHGEGAPGA